MHDFGVWAPRAQRVEVETGGQRLTMSPAGRGWWARRAADAGPGSDYAFSLDGGPPRPDPRSASQPGGVHGPSRVVDHTAFRWSDSGWRGLPLAGSVLYECHIGTFSAAGTFDGAIEHLDHIAALGVDAIELMPVAEFPGRRGWGYDGVALFAPQDAYGGPDGLRRLVDAAHARGLGVIMDVVYNHLGPEGNYLPEFGPYFSAQHQTNWGDAINFDGPGSDEVRRFVIDNALMWLRRAAPGRRARHHRRFSDPHPRSARRRGGRARRARAPPPLPHRGERPQRPTPRPEPRRRRLRPRRILG